MNEIGYVSVIGTEEVLEGMTDDSFPPVDASYMFGDAGRAAHLNYVYYPDKSVIDRCALMHDCGEKTEAMVEMWSRVKGDNLESWVIILIVVVLGAAIAWGVYNKIQTKKRQAKRKKKKSQRRR
jgi:spermidine/putrescine transport system substrate-binding protein